MANFRLSGPFCRVSVFGVCLDASVVKTFSVQTLGCKVNQYEGGQLAALLRARGLTEAVSPGDADLRVVHTCSVTVQAASKSRQTIRRTTRQEPASSGRVALTVIDPSTGSQERECAEILA